MESWSHSISRNLTYRMKCFQGWNNSIISFVRKFYTQRRTLGSDDLKFFKCFRVIFSFKKKTSQFPLSFNLYFQQKKEPQSCQFAIHRRKTLFEFLTSQTGQMAYVIFNVIIRSLCISLSHQQKAVHHFENTLKSLTEIMFLS